MLVDGPYWAGGGGGSTRCVSEWQKMGGVRVAQLREFLWASVRGVPETGIVFERVSARVSGAVRCAVRCAVLVSRSGSRVACESAASRGGEGASGVIVRSRCRNRVARV